MEILIKEVGISSLFTYFNQESEYLLEPIEYTHQKGRKKDLYIF